MACTEMGKACNRYGLVWAGPAFLTPLSQTKFHPQIEKDIYIDLLSFLTYIPFSPKNISSFS